MKTRSFARAGPLLCLVLSIAGASLSGLLLRAHAVGKSDTGLLAAACGDGGGCDKVLNSRWGVFPPAPEKREPPAGEVGPPPPGPAPAAEPPAEGVPVAALGLFYFTVLAVWFAALGVPAWPKRWLHRLLLAFCTFGALGSLWFIFVMSFHVGAWCVFCLASHLGNFAILALAALLRPRAESLEAAPPAAAAGAHPSGRLIATAAAFALSLMAAEWFAYRSLAAEKRSEHVEAVKTEISRDIANCEEAMKLLAEKSAQVAEFQQAVDKLEATYFQEVQHEILIRDDDPIILDSGQLRQTAVLFSDIECPHCAKFDQFLFEEVAPVYNGHLRIVFKHYPLTSIHPNAFKAATALEAARLQGKFWEAKKLLIERRESLASLDYSELGAELGLDAGRFVQDMGSPAVANRVRDDMKLAQSLKLTTTPSVFLNGRQVARFFRSNIGFWKLRADALRRSREEAKQGW